MENHPTRKLVVWLLISSTLNIIFVTFFFYWMIKERPPTPYFESKPASSNQQQTPFAIDHSNQELIRYFKTLTLEQLVYQLGNKKFVENGYSVRDLSLACLVTFHHFDLSRALLDDIQPKEMRLISYGLKKDGKQAKVLAYPGLSEKQYESIIAFAKRERWPLSPKGLFLNLKINKHKQNISLQDAFYLTPEFLSVETLFSRSNNPVKKQEILNVLLDGSFAMLSQFTENQKQFQDLTKAKRQHFLLEYVKLKSKAAAYLLLKTDGPQIVRKLDDSSIKMILMLLTDQTKEAFKFALTLLTSPRGESVWQMAATKLYEYQGEDLPEKIEYEATILKFLPKEMHLKQKPLDKIHVNAITDKVSINNTDPSHKLRENAFYTVQEGDSLWKISRRFDIDIDDLKRHNQLSSDVLKPGTSLKIP